MSLDKNEISNFLENLKKKYYFPIPDYSFSELITLLCREKFEKITPYTPEFLADVYERISNTCSFSEFEKLRKIVILECMLNSWNDIFSNKYPESIQEQFKKNAVRIFNLCQTDQGWSQYKEDIYWKDLSIARQQCIPVGPVIIETYSGFGFRQGISINIFQTFKFLYLIFRLGGKECYYQSHVHIPLLSEFNEKGWYKAYIRIGELLKRNKRVKGVFGTAWFRDPQLEKISPNLIYLRKLPLENGAQFFDMGKDTSGNAFAKSKTRRKLYDEGKYIPHGYLMIWPRRELIKWADKQMIGQQKIS